MKWIKADIVKEALNYTTRKNFANGSGGCYNAARRLEILDEVCSHMPIIYKIGVTSWELGLRRIKSVASAHKYSYDVIGMVHVEDARSVEKILLDTYRYPPTFMQELDGHTEFRVLTDTEVVEIVDFLYQEATSIGTNNFKFELCTLI